MEVRLGEVLIPILWNSLKSRRLNASLGRELSQARLKPHMRAQSKQEEASVSLIPFPSLAPVLRQRVAYAGEDG